MAAFRNAHRIEDLNQSHRASATMEDDGPTENGRTSMASTMPAGTRSGLDYQPLTARQLSALLQVPRSWILRQSNPGVCRTPIPCLILGRHKRYLWQSPELSAWLEQCVVYSGSPTGGQPPTANCEYLDSAELASRLNISVSWVRDQVRTRAEEPIPHARFGKYVRFRWGSAELANWAEQHMLSINNRG